MAIRLGTMGLADRPVAEEAMVTALFVDIRNFTELADRSTAREAVGLLNEFFGLVVPLLVEHGGHANKFLGDGVLGVFGAPDRLPDHADRGVAAAVEIAAAAESRFGGRFRVGVGVNSGLVLAGTIGGGGKHEFGVIGDPVNVAARVEKATRDLGEPVLVTEATRCLLDGSHARLEPRGSVVAKGKPEPIPVYAPRVGAER
jgi:adenylate cyclase